MNTGIQQPRRFYPTLAVLLEFDTGTSADSKLLHRLASVTC